MKIEPRPGGDFVKFENSLTFTVNRYTGVGFYVLREDEKQSSGGYMRGFSSEKYECQKSSKLF